MVVLIHYGTVYFKLCDIDLWIRNINTNLMIKNFADVCPDFQMHVSFRVDFTRPCPVLMTFVNRKAYLACQNAIYFLYLFIFYLNYKNNSYIRVRKSKILTLNWPGEQTNSSRSKINYLLRDQIIIVNIWYFAVVRSYLGYRDIYRTLDKHLALFYRYFV